MMRRKLLGLLAAPLALRGTGGTPPQPAGYVEPSLPGQAPGATSKVVRARRVIVSGPGQGVFVYNGPPAAGNLIESMSSGGTDGFTNQLVNGVAAYGSNFAIGLTGGLVQFYTGSLAGGWTATGNLAIPLSSNELDINFTSILLPATILAVSGGTITILNNVVVTGTLSVNGSTSTGLGDNGGVTSGPSGTVNSFPAAGPNHTHAEAHHHPL